LMSLCRRVKIVKMFKNMDSHRIGVEVALHKVETLVMAVVLLYTAVGLTGVDGEYEITSDHIQPRNLRIREVIRINSDEEFALMAASEGWPGNGTADNPYVIENYMIDAGGAGAGIFIGNTTVHFVVRGCYIINALYSSFPYHVGAGISLYNVANATVENNTCTKNSLGIMLYFVRGFRVLRNNCTYNGGAGISVMISGLPPGSLQAGVGGGGVSATRPSAFFSAFRHADPGIPPPTAGLPDVSVEGDESGTERLTNVVANNTCSWNEMGISVQYSTNIVLVDNVCDGNRYGLHVRGSWESTLSRNKCTGNTSGNIAGISLDECRNVSVEDNACTGNTYGIAVTGGMGNAIRRNTCTYNKVGILLEDSRENIVHDNKCGYNSGDERDTRMAALPSPPILPRGCGILLYSSDRNSLRGNICQENTFAGILLIDSESNMLIGNVCSRCGRGLYLDGSTHTRVYGNVMIKCSIMINGGFEAFTTQDIPTNNTVNGKPVYYFRNESVGYASVPEDAGQVILGNVMSLEIKNLSIENTTAAILVGHSSAIRISGNELYDNVWGIYIWKSSNIRVESNVCSLSHVGVAVKSSENIRVGQNALTGNKVGLLICESTRCTVDRNTFNRNDDGAVLRNSGECVVSNNSFTENAVSGIYLYYSEDISVEYNTCGWNRYGIRLMNSNRNRIIRNTLSNNTNYGVFIVYGRGNRIYGNFFWYNNGATNRYNRSHVQAYDNTGQNWWNSSRGYGNFWNDWAYNNDTSDVNRDGIVDWPYVIDGGAGAVDHYPISAPAGDLMVYYVFILSIIFAVLVSIVYVWRRRRKKIFKL